MAKKRKPNTLKGSVLVPAKRARERVELAALRGETAIEHRAFLLWVMAGGANYRGGKELLDAIAQTVSLPIATMRINFRNRRFVTRASEYPEPGSVAWATYKRLYLGAAHGADVLGLAELLNPPADCVPELWRLTADEITEALAFSRKGSKRAHGVQAEAARSDAATFGPNTADPGGLADVVAGTEDAVAKLVFQARMKRPKDTSSTAEAKRRAVEAVAAEARKVADGERAGGDKVVLTRQDARNILRSIVGTPLTEESLREVDRELLKAARAASPDAEVRLLSLLATQRAEAEAAAVDPTDRLIKLVDASFGYFAQELKHGRVKVSMSSLPMLIKARALLTGGATSRTEHTGLLDARGPNLRDSARVADARQSQDKTALVRAMREDVAELAVILDALGEVGDEAGGEGPTVIDVESEPVTSAAGGEG